MVNAIDSFTFTRTAATVSSQQSYSETLRTQRQQAKDTSLKLKKLKYSFKSISSKILRSKTSTAAKQAARQAKREVARLKWEKRNGDHDSEEIDAAITHAKAIERVAKKKVKHLEEEERAEAAGKNSITEGVDTQEEADIPDDTAQQDEMQDAQHVSDVMAVVCEQPAIEDVAEEMLSDMTEEMEQLQEEMGLGDLFDALLSASDEVDPEDLKLLKIKHRNKEVRDIAKADADYLKAMFSHYEKMKENAAGGSGQNTAVPSGVTAFSANSGGSMPVVTAGVPAPAMVVDVSV